MVSPSSRSLRARGAAALAAVGVAFTPTPSAGAEDQVPVLAQQEVGAGDEGQAVLTIHGVRRLADSAVIYFSAGIPEGGSGSLFDALGSNHTAFGNSTSSMFANAAAIDPKGKKIYTALHSGGNSSCFCTQSLPSDSEPGKAYVGYTRIAQLPKSVQRVDVFLGQQVFHGMPVQDGALSPQLDTDQLSAGAEREVVLGKGWPKPATRSNPALSDPKPVPSADAQKKFVLDLTQRTRNAGLTDAGASFELSGDVLFAFDKADLTSKGKKAVAKIVASLKQREISTVTVTGHTDNEGTDARNQPLSEQRAKTVADALKEEMPDLKVTSSGKGSAEPVASNDTEAGRQANRRVEVVPAGGTQ